MDKILKREECRLFCLYDTIIVFKSTLNLLYFFLNVKSREKSPTILPYYFRKAYSSFTFFSL